MTALALPDVRLHRSWLACVADFAGEHVHGGGTAPNDPARVAQLADPERFARYVDELRAEALRETPRPADRVPATSWWIVDQGAAADGADEVVGFLQLRHELNAFLLEEGGHIGYSVRPGARRRGHAGRALAASLPLARDLGLPRVLLVVDEDNTASRATVERRGGEHEDSRHGKRRYWVATPPRP